MTEHNPVEDLLRVLVEDLYTVDATDVPAALGAAWRGFDAVDAAGGLLAESHVDYAALRRNARPVLDRADETLRSAPALPDVKPLMLNVAGERPGPLSDHLACAVHRDILDVVYGLLTLLPAVAGHARDGADRRACREAARLAHDLVNCYEGRLNPFLARG